MEKLMWYRTPTQDYMEGLPLGNGRLAAMALGTPERFRLALNHEWLWRGENRLRDFDDVHEHLSKVRELLLAGRFAEGTRLANDYFGGGGSMKGVPNRVDPYQPAGDLFIGLDAGEAARYTRALDLASGLASVEFDSALGHVVESAFVSAADGVIVARVESVKRGALDIELSRITDARCAVSYRERALDGGGRELTLHGEFERGICFEIALRVFTDGRATPVERGYRIADARDTLLIVQIGTDARGGVPGDELTFPVNMGFDALFARHYAAFGELLGTAELDIPLPDSDLPTDERVREFRAGNDPGIPLLYFEYGRYLMASGSSGELPLNLQGKWNELLAPPWESDYHLDINLEMCYWFVETLGMERAADTLFNLIERYVPHGREMARKLYGCRGVVFPIQTDVWGRMTPEAYGWAVWIGAAPWLAQHMYEHWLYTRDVEFARTRCYPMLREVARFYMDYIIERDGVPCIVPSQSPENRFEGGGDMPVTLGYDSAMDRELAHASLRAAVELAGALGEDADEAASWADMEARLPWPGIDSQGRVMEFDSERVEVEPGHRHLSHLIGLHPLRLFEPGTPLWQAAERSLDSRLSHGGGHTGWSRSWVACMMARLGRADDAWRHFIALIADFATVSLLDLHPPRLFQIDGNMGGAAAVCEMLMQSREGELRLLPALPGQWPEGCVRGFRALGDVQADFEWNDGMLTGLTLRCGRNAGGALRVSANGREWNVELRPDAVVQVL